MLIKRTWIRYNRKALGNKGNYYNTFEKWLPKESKVTHSVTEFGDGFPAPSLEWRENND